MPSARLCKSHPLNAKLRQQDPTSFRLCTPHAQIGDHGITVQGCKCPLITRHNEERDQHQVMGPAYLHGALHEHVTRIVDEK